MSITFRKRPDHTLSTPPEAKEPHLDLHSIDARADQAPVDDDIPVLLPEPPTSAHTATSPTVGATPGRIDSAAPVRQPQDTGAVHIPPPPVGVRRQSPAQSTPAWQDEADDMPVLMPAQRPAQVPPFGSSTSPRPTPAPHPVSQSAAGGGINLGRQDESRHARPASAQAVAQAADPSSAASTPLPPDRGLNTQPAEQPYLGTQVPGAPYRWQPEGDQSAIGSSPQGSIASTARAAGQSDAAPAFAATSLSSSPLSGAGGTPASPSAFPGHPTPDDYAPFLNTARGAQGHHSKPELYVWSDDENDAFSQAAQADFTLNRIQPTAGRPSFDASLFRAPSRPDALAATAAPAVPRLSDPAADMQAEIDALVTELLDESHEYLKRRLLEEIPEIIAKYRHDH
ncbi:hypothetical protein [Advenella sp. FME57]|uniref:hypothetical protein n=2 Tax=unclassified Advenella TaxID=2685285 RepID=UPI00186691EA|nr:hypothetical protein [Advenella sp. FME57]